MVAGNPAAKGSTWGQPIVDAFVANGGFSNSSAMRSAHEWFLQLVRNSPSEGLDGEERARILSVWALICLELDVQRVDLEILGEAIDATRDEIAGGRYWLWLGQLAFDLVRYKINHGQAIRHDDSEAALRAVQAARIDLFETIKDAFDVALSSIENSRSAAPPCDWTTVELRECLFGSGARLAPVGPIARRFLANLASQEGIEEGLILLALTEPKAERSVSWLNKARDAKWCQVRVAASFLLGLSGEDPTSKTDLSPNFNDVKFPTDLELEDYRFLSSLALRAKVLWFPGPQPARPEFLWLYSRYVAEGERDEVAKTLTYSRELNEQAVSTEIWLERAREYVESSRDFYSEEEIKGAFDTLVMQTAKLIEVFLKSCLLLWREKVDELPDDLSDPKWNDYRSSVPCHFNVLVGPTLGQGAAAMDLVTLLEKAGQKTSLTRVGKQLERLLIKRNQKKQASSRKDRLGSRFNFPELLIANAIAASGNPDHIFRRLPVERLEELCGALGGAWGFRPQAAHWQMDSVCQSEAFFWAWTVLQTINKAFSLQGNSVSNKTVVF